MFMTILYIIAGLIALLIIRGLILKLLRKQAEGQLAKSRMSAFLQEIQAAINTDDLPQLQQKCSHANEEQIQQLSRYASENDLPIFDRWAESEPDNVMAQYLCGINLMKRAQDARTGKLAKDLKTEEVLDYSLYFSKAKQALVKANELQPTFLPVYAPLIAASTGQKDQAWSYYARAYELDPLRADYQYNMLLVLTAKWGGSREEMFNFARDVVKKHPNTTLAGLLARAHIEEWLYLGMCKEIRKYGGYFEQEEVIKEVSEVYATLPPEIDGSGIQQDRLLALNHFALCLVETAQKEQARTVFAKIGVNYTGMPWVYFGKTPADAFLRYRKKAGLGYQVD